MKRLLLILVCGAALTLWAQEGEHAPAKEGEPVAAEHGEGKSYEGWKWANFAILAIVLGWGLGKALPPFFKSRTAEIQKGIAEAQALKADAEKRATQMEYRLAALSSEVEEIRGEAATAMAKEVERIQQDTAAHMVRMQAHAEQEIAAISKHATQALKAYAAQLALELAEQRIRGRMDQAAQGVLVERFVRQIDSPRGGARI